MSPKQLFNDALAALENKYIGTIVSLFLVLYGGLARPELPTILKTLLANDIFRVIYVFVLAYIADKNVQVALVCAVVFMVLNGLWADAEVKEAFENLDDVDETWEEEEPEMFENEEPEMYENYEEEPEMFENYEEEPEMFENYEEEPEM
jgi:hypothetical protein